jgi:hypothetical protein
MATATLNGAVESGVAAGDAAAMFAETAARAADKTTVQIER